KSSTIRISFIRSQESGVRSQKSEVEDCLKKPRALIESSIILAPEFCFCFIKRREQSFQLLRQSDTLINDLALFREAAVPVYKYPEPSSIECETCNPKESPTGSARNLESPRAVFFERLESAANRTTPECKDVSVLRTAIRPAPIQQSFLHTSPLLDRRSPRQLRDRE